jgi:TfoX/Sxy family transcriptional regulator of competence genes
LPKQNKISIISDIGHLSLVVRNGGDYSTQRRNPMAYSEALAQRIRAVLQDELGVTERKMFGGLAFMLRGNMCCGVVKDELMLRVGAEQYAAALARPHARPMDFTGKPMKGMIYVDTTGVATADNLAEWVQWGVNFAGSLPPK